MSEQGPYNAGHSPDLDSLPSTYETNTPPELEPPPPMTNEPEMEEISPNELSVEDPEKGENKTEQPSGHPFGNNREPEGMPTDWKPNKIMRRADWGAVKPKWIESLNIPVEKIAVSFTETDPCYTEDECQKVVRKLQKEHMEEENVPDIKHNFLIGGDEVIYEGRGYMRLGPVYKPSPKKIEELNGKSIDIAIIERSGSKPSNGVIAALSYCIAHSVHSNCVTSDFHTYYIMHGEIGHVEAPPNRQKLNDSTPSKISSETTETV